MHNITQVKSNNKIRIKVNNSPKDFNKAISSIIQEICQPIFDLGITMFTYCRIFENNGKRLYVSSNPEWVQYYISHDFQDDLDHLEHYVPDKDIKYTLWSGFKMDKVFSAAYHLFNYWHGFTIYEKHRDYVDYFDFACHRSNDRITNYFIHSIDLLSYFILHFKEQTSTLIDYSDPNQLLTSKLCLPFSEIPREVSFLKKVSISHDKRRPKLVVIQGDKEIKQNSLINRVSSCPVSGETQYKLDSYYSELKKLEISYIGHGIVSQTGNHTGYFSNKDWGLYYIKNNFFFIEPILNEFDKKDATFLTWNNISSNNIVQKMRHNFTGITSGLTICSGSSELRYFFNIGFIKETDLAQFIFFNKDLLNSFFERFNNCHLAWRNEHKRQIPF